MADKTIVDRECTNEFGETRLVMFALLHLDKIKCPSSNVIKSGKKIRKKEKSILGEVGFSEKTFPVETSFKPQVYRHFFLRQIMKLKNNHIISSNKRFSSRQIA